MVIFSQVSLIVRVLSGVREEGLLFASGGMEGSCLVIAYACTELIPNETENIIIDSNSDTDCDRQFQSVKNLELK